MFEKDGLCFSVCSTQGDLYDEKEIDIVLPLNNGVVKALEYKHKTKMTQYKTEIYKFIKLAIGLLNKDKIYEN